MSLKASMCKIVNAQVGRDVTVSRVHEGTIVVETKQDKTKAVTSCSNQLWIQPDRMSTCVGATGGDC